LTILFAALASVPFLVRLDLWFFERQILQIRPWIVLTVAFAPFALACVLRSATGSVPRIRRDGILLGAAVLLVGAIEVSGLSKWLTAPKDAQVLFFYWLDLFTVFCGFCLGRALRTWPRARLIFLAALAVDAAAVLADWSFPGLLSISSLGGRPAGFSGNPNGAAFVAVPLLIGALEWAKPVVTWRQALIIAGALGIAILCGSRGGLAAILAVLCLFWLRVSFAAARSGETIKRLVIGSIVIVTGLVASAAAAWASESRLIAVMLEGMLTDYASEQRFLALEASWNLMAAAPFLGHGTGYAYTMDVGPHNMVLRMWVENGLLAVVGYGILYSAIIYVAVNRRDWWIGTAAVAALVMGMVSHNMLEDRTLLISFGIFLAMSRAPLLNQRQSSNTNPPNARRGANSR
jgi:O-antigen ligase